jgi:hypothetical protein
VLLIQADRLPAGAAEQKDKTVNPFEFLSNPHLFHAAVVHFPVALGILGIPLVAVCGIVGKNATLRRTTQLLQSALITERRLTENER